MHLWFQSTRPVRDATSCLVVIGFIGGCFNPRAPYGTRRAKDMRRAELSAVSIHAPRTGRDGARVSIRSFVDGFQSTRPVRDATDRDVWPCLAYRRFNPRAPYGTRQVTENFCGCAKCVSIHAPRTGRDRPTAQCLIYFTQFQSTRPVRDAT